MNSKASITALVLNVACDGGRIVFLPDVQSVSIQVANFGDGVVRFIDDVPALSTAQKLLC